MSERYSTQVKESSELTKREVIKLSTIKDTVGLDDVTKDGAFDLQYKGYVLFAVHNAAAEQTDYEKLLILDEGGTVYSTSSSSFIAAFSDLMNMVAELKADGDTEPVVIHCTRHESKNYKGKQFLSCSLG